MRRLILILLVLGMLVVALASCAGPTPTPEVIVETVEVPVKETVVVTPAPEEEVIEIEFWYHSMIEEAKTYLDDLIAQWNEENPTIQVKAFGVMPLDEERVKFISAMAVGDAPDIVYFSAPYLPEVVEMGALAPLEEIFPEDFFNQYTDAINALHTHNGHLYAVPLEGPTWGMFYRKDLFEEAGLDPEKPPATWEELLEYARKLTKKDASGKVIQYGLAFPAMGHEADEYWQAFIYQAGGKIAVYDPEAKKWVSTMDSPEVKQGTEFWASLVREEGVTPPPDVIVATNWESAAKGLVSGEYAMIFDGMWAMSTIQQELPAEKWGSALYPAGPAGRATLGFSVCLSVASQSKHKPEVAQFLTWLLSPEHHNKFATLTTTMSWRKDFLDTDVAKHPHVRPFVEGTQYSMAPPGATYWAIFRDKVEWPTLQQILLGQITVDAGLEKLHKGFSDLHD